MARQTGAVSGKSRRRNQIAELNARQGGLTGLIANQDKATALGRQKELDALQVAQSDRSHNLSEQQFSYNKKAAKENRALANRQSQIGMGLEASKMGMNVGMNYSGKSLGDISRSTMTGVGFGAGSGPAVGGWTDKVDVGSAVGGGLLGYGAGQLIGGKSKAKKAGIGMLAGGLMGMLSGPKGSGMNFGSMISGGLGGAFGGMFG